MKALGRLMQIAGLIALPIAVVLELTGGLDRTFGVSEMIILLIFGVAVFGVGRLVEGYARG